MPVCKMCNIDKPLVEFRIRKDTNKPRSECICCQAAYNKKYRQLNKEQIQSKVKESYKLHREQRLQKAKQFYQDNKDLIKARIKKYQQDNKNKIKRSRKKYQKTRLKEDPTFRTIRNLRNRLWYALENKNWKKNSNFANYIGLSNYEDLKLFLERNFEEGMTWDNYGTFWDIDHIIPLSTAETEEQLYKLCHYTNLIPKKCLDNRVIKRDNFDFNAEYSVQLLEYKQGQDFLIKHHYLHRKSPSEYTFGLFLKNGTLVGVCTFHTPYSPGLKEMICGPLFADEVLELNRLCVLDYLPKNSESWFVSKCINSGELNKHIIVSFADTEQNHNGTVYQALNFIYTGTTDPKKDFFVEGLEKHSATLASNTVEELKNTYGNEFKYVNRSKKHRYVLFIGNNKDIFKNNLLLESKPYPK